MEIDKSLTTNDMERLLKENGECYLRKKDNAIIAFVYMKSRGEGNNELASVIQKIDGTFQEITDKKYRQELLDATVAALSPNEYTKMNPEIPLSDKEREEILYIIQLTTKQ